jgi:hypothetical protein
MLRWLCWSGTAEADGLFARQPRFLATFTHFWIESENFRCSSAQLLILAKKDDFLPLV